MNIRVCVGVVARLYLSGREVDKMHVCKGHGDASDAKKVEKCIISITKWPGSRSSCVFMLFPQHQL